MQSNKAVRLPKSNRSKGLWLVLILAISGLAVAQDSEGKLGKRPATPAELNRQALTLQDLDQTQSALDKAMQALLPGAKLGKPIDLKPGSTQANRSHIIRTYHRQFLAAKPLFKLKPRPVVFDKSVLNTTDPATKAALEELITWGFVSRIGNIATGTGAVTLEEFGDTLGFFLSRMSELTHQPSVKWTPFLQRPDQQER